MPKLSLQEIHDNMGQLNDWELVGHEIQRTFHFENFENAMKFVNKVAEVAEKLNHHPEIYIKYDKVTLTLTTHSLGGLTENDFEVAKEVDKIEIL